jgi:hypothetical protein
MSRTSWSEHHQNIMIRASWSEHYDQYRCCLMLCVIVSEYSRQLLQIFSIKWLLTSIDRNPQGIHYSYVKHIVGTLCLIALHLTMLRSMDPRSHDVISLPNVMGVHYRCQCPITLCLASMMNLGSMISFSCVGDAHSLLFHCWGGFNTSTGVKIRKYLVMRVWRHWMVPSSVNVITNM